MKTDKRFRVFVILTAIFFSIFLAIMLIGAILPDEPSRGVPWYAWAMIGDVVAFVVASGVVFAVFSKKAQKDENKTRQ